MLEGFSINVAGTELAAHFSARMSHYHAKAEETLATLERVRVAPVAPVEVIDALFAEGPQYLRHGLPTHPWDQKQMVEKALVRKAKEHSDCAARFDFYLTHIDRAKTFPLNQLELASLELVNVMWTPDTLVARAFGLVG